MPGETKAVRIRTIIEVLGSPKEHVERSIKQYIENIKEDKDLVVLEEYFSDAKEKEKFWLKFAELELVVKGTQKLINFCFEYMPSSIEILKPDSFVFSQAEMGGFLNDLQARLHNVDMVAKQLRNENAFVRRNMGSILANNIMLLLKLSGLDIWQLSKLTGVQEEELNVFLDNMIKENKIKKEGEIYSLIEN